MRDTPNSNLPPPHLLEALRPRPFQRFAATRMTPKERAALILQLQAEYLGIPKGTGAPPPRLLDALRSCSPGRAEPVSRLVRPGATGQTSRQTGARRQPRQPSVEIGKNLFKTLQADAASGRSRSLSARGAASVAMYLASVEKQERMERMDRLVRPGAPDVAQSESRMDKLMEEFSDDAIAEIAAEHGVTTEEIRANPRAYISDMRDAYISFELPRVGPSG